MASMSSDISVAFLLGECKMLFMTSVWLFCCLQYFLPFLVLGPLYFVPVVGMPLYRKLHDMYDKFGVVCTMTVPFSWCGFAIHYRNYEAFKRIEQGSDALVLSTHCSRIDWLIGTYLSVINGHLVAFVAEATTALMPIIGWQRWLAGDIFVTRAFHKDGPRIEGNIASYKKSGISRLLFLAPEGFVADPGSAVGEAYLPQCDEFMAKEGRQPLTHLLTPRYKGMQAFVRHAPSNVISVAMAYVQDAVVESGTGKLLSGTLYSRGLRDSLRTIPDLHSVFRGGLSVLIQGGQLTIDGTDPQKLKEQMLDDQEMKDRMMREWQATGAVLGDDAAKAYYAGTHPPQMPTHGSKRCTYPAAARSLTTLRLLTIACGRSPTEYVAPLHIWLNVYLALHTAASACAVSLVLRISIISACWCLAGTIGAIALVHGSTHYAARLATGSGSTESLCGETAIKAALALFIRAFKGMRNALIGPRSKSKKVE